MKYKAYQEKKKAIGGEKIIGIDPSKRSHQCAIIDAQGVPMGNSFSIEVNYKGFNETLWQKTINITGTHKNEDIVFAVENSCDLWQTIANYLREKGYKVVLVSPLITHHSRPLINQDFSKTDPKDALLIAINAHNGNYNEYRRYESETEALHQLSIAYNKLMKDLTRNLLRLRAFMNQVFPEYMECIEIGIQSSLYLLNKYFLPKHFLALDVKEEGAVIKSISKNQYGEDDLKKIKALAEKSIGIDKSKEEGSMRLMLDSWIKQIKEVKEQTNNIMSQMIEIASKKDYYEIIKSIKGISDKLASQFIAECRELENYTHYKQIEKHAGLNLRQSQSGEYIGARHISRIGNRRLSHIVYQMTEQTTRYIPEVRIKYLKRQLKKRVYRKNIIASAPQLLRLIVSLVKGRRNYKVNEERVKELSELEREYNKLKKAV